MSYTRERHWHCRPCHRDSINVNVILTWATGLLAYLALRERAPYGGVMERPTLRQLEILAEVARAGTFRGAARHLGLSQVAVSDHIRQLENRLGCELFVRNVGGKPTMSPSGKIVLEHGRNVLFACDALIAASRNVADNVRTPIVLSAAKDIAEKAMQDSGVADADDHQRSAIQLDYTIDLDEVETAVTNGDVLHETPDVGGDLPDSVSAVSVNLADVMKGIAQEDSGADEDEVGEKAVLYSATIAPSTEENRASTLEPVNEKPITIASHPAILSRFQDRLAAAQEAFPDRPIAVDFARFTPNTVTVELASGRADIALFYALGEVSGLPSEYLWSESWSLFARADHPLAQAETLGIADCMDMPVILFEETNPLRALCEACLKKAGLWPTPTVLETDDFAAIITELLEYGEAVFPAFGITAAQFAAQPGIKRLALVEPLPAVQVRRAVSSAGDEDPTIAALAGLLG